MKSWSCSKDCSTRNVSLSGSRGKVDLAQRGVSRFGTVLAPFWDRFGIALDWSNLIEQSWKCVACALGPMLFSCVSSAKSGYRGVALIVVSRNLRLNRWMPVLFGKLCSIPILGHTKTGINQISVLFGNPFWTSQVVKSHLSKTRVAKICCVFAVSRNPLGLNCSNIHRKN